MHTFRRINNLTGWLVFAVAFLTYAATMERTASFWDCGEFIAVAYKLMVPHPPGAPLFLLIGRLFSMLALGDVTKVAYWVNMVSVLASAFTILFLFWTITILARKLLNKAETELTTAETWLVMGAGVVGSLAYTWSDSFWFSAVEAEVYGLSSFFTAIVIWAMYKWEAIDDEAAANRWLIFIAYLIGLSIGVHLLNLVTLPALALIYYFKKYRKPSIKGGLLAVFIGVLILGFINAGIIPGLPTVAFQFELLFVNTFGLPFNSGALFFTLLLIGGLVWAIRYSIRKQNALLNTALLALSFILIGYISYTLVLVRANYNPPINENDPKDAVGFTYYLKREQYGSRPLLYGPVFTAQAIDIKKGAPMYKKQNGRYVVYKYRPEYVWEADQQMLLPRVHSHDPGHPDLYRQMLNLPEGKKPTFGDNLRFMFSHQMGHMYMRYFLWNFAGRESDVEGAGSLPKLKGGDFPESITHNKGHDNFYFLPLILGLLGFFIQYRKEEKDFLVVTLIFLMTGLALVVFINSPPTEPRERDYIYVGSFYAFAIWIGLGVLQLAEWLEKVVKNATARAGVATVVCALVPLLMVSKSWDNHNRNHRYQSVDFAKNMLSSCAPNAILFTGGDNDTFPLWYVQEVEGFRTDVRVCNLSLLGTGWYIDQMKRKTYQSDPLPISLDKDKFLEGVNDDIPFLENPNVKGGINLKEYLKLIEEDNPAIKVPTSMDGQMINTLPSANFFLPIDKAAVQKMPFVSEQFRPFVTDTMAWTYGKKDIYKPELIQLDIIASNNWKRPVYFSSTIGQESYLNLREYMQLEGFAYRLMPFKVPGARDGFVNSDIMYENMMKKTAWRDMDNPNTYYDATYDTPIFSSRVAFLRLSDQLLREGKRDKAKEVMNRCLTVMPDKAIPYDQVSVSFIGPLLEVGERQKALDIAEKVMRRNDENLAYFTQLPDSYSKEINNNLYEMNLIVSQLKDAKINDLATKYEAIFNKYYSKLAAN
jgi:tetratricopeptide (TPR) repeat protein